ncbi:chemotaxis protein CheA [Natronomonas salsuginis]|uniref:Chemotaxis protein CheA n=1 Tax=Natronomonas salsuginis TaxID=2217661 RepID=A0A4U5JHE6_9EURY|nr:chemotaxis protein CheA [Natronomonas salsuginis]TKR28295.1 chemotaxis protein CheA [Natronomonas salsuginis]
MNDDHIHAFVSECRENITDLNNALLALEDDPDDDEAIESVFRTAHTLKGNFGAMGFSNASELAHVLEDLLDEIRGGEIEVTPDIMDAAFDGVDRIETIVGEIDRDGESATDPVETTARLRAAIDAGAAHKAASDTGDSTSGAEVGASSAVSPPPMDDADKFAHGRISVDPEGMLGVDALLILEALADAFGEFRTVPPRDEVEEGAYDGSFDVFVPDVSADAFGEELDGIGAVESFEVSTGTPRTDTDAPDSAPPGDDGDEENQRTTSSTGGNDISSVRVDVDRLDELHGLVEQLVTGRITIRRAIEEGDTEMASTSLNDFDKMTSRLQNTVMDMRLIPLRRVVSNLPRVVRDVARSQGKDVSFEMRGEDIELDRSILTEIEDPLIHILRNAVDHGVESPDAREAAGKPREGTIELRASRQRDHVTIAVSDDGGGIDPDEMRAKAAEENVIPRSEAETLSDDEAYDLVFHPGFSTAGEVTDVSGRGVGMDVVHSTVEQLDGTVNVESALGEGTTVELRLPVSVAIVDVLFVAVGDREYGIPIKNIDELTHAAETETVHGTEVVRHDDEVYPVIELGDALHLDGEAAFADGETLAADGGTLAEASDDDDEMLVRIRQSVRPVALRCDSFSDQEEVVVKPLEGPLSGIPGIGGTAILGDGNIVPILDVVSLEE